MSKRENYQTDYPDMTVDQIVTVYQDKIDELLGQVRGKLMLGNPMKAADRDKLNAISTKISSLHRVAGPAHDMLLKLEEMRPVTELIEEVTSEEDKNDPDIQAVIDEVRSK